MEVPIVEKTFSLPQSLFERVWASQQSAPVASSHSATILSGSTAQALPRRPSGDYVSDLTLIDVKRPRLLSNKESLDEQTNLQREDQEKCRVSETQRQEKTKNGVWKPFEQQGILELTSKPCGTSSLEALHSQFLTTLRGQGSSEAVNVDVSDQSARTQETRHVPLRRITYGTISLAGVALNHKTYPKIVAVHSLMNNSSKSSFSLNHQVAGAAVPVSQHCKESRPNAKTEVLKNRENCTLINKPSVLPSEYHQPDALFPNNDDDDVVVTRVVCRNVSLSKEGSSEGEQVQNVYVRKDDGDSFKNTNDPAGQGLVGQKANPSAFEHLGFGRYPRGGGRSRHSAFTGNRANHVDYPKPSVEPPRQELKPRSVKCAVVSLLSLPRSGDPSRHSDSTEIGNPSNRFGDPKPIEPLQEQRPSPIKCVVNHPLSLPRCGDPIRHSDSTETGNPSNNSDDPKPIEPLQEQRPCSVSCDVNHPFSLPRCGDPIRHSDSTETGNPSNNSDDPKPIEPLQEQRPCSVSCDVNHPLSHPRCGDPLRDSFSTGNVSLSEHMEHPKSGINPSLSELQLKQSDDQAPVLPRSENSEATKEGNDAREKYEERLRTPSKVTKTVSEISQKIIETRERMKHETIGWKKAVLVRLERHLIKKLRRVERLTGEKTEIKDLQQAASELVTKGSKSKGQGKEKPERRKTVTEEEKCGDIGLKKKESRDIITDGNTDGVVDDKVSTGSSGIKGQTKNLTDNGDIAIKSNEEKLGDIFSIGASESLVVSRNPDAHTLIQKQGRKQESESFHIEKDEKREGSQDVEVSSGQATNNLEVTEEKAKEKATYEVQSLQTESTNRNSFLRDKSDDMVDCETNEQLCEVIATQKAKPRKSLDKDGHKSREFSGVANKIKLDEDFAEDASQGHHKGSRVTMSDARVELQAENMREGNIFDAVSIEQSGHESLRQNQCSLQVVDVKPLTITDLHSSSTAKKPSNEVDNNAASLKIKLDNLVKTCLDVDPKMLDCERNIWSSLEKQGII